MYVSVCPPPPFWHLPIYIYITEKINKGEWLDWDGVNWPVVQWSRELKSKMSL